MFGINSLHKALFLLLLVFLSGIVAPDPCVKEVCRKGPDGKEACEMAG